MRFPRIFPFLLLACPAALQAPAASAEIGWIAATDRDRVVREGRWLERNHRYAPRLALVSGPGSGLGSDGSGSALDLEFAGTGLSVRFGELAVPAYGGPAAGTLAVSIDGLPVAEIVPRANPYEVVVARGLPAGTHRLRVEVRNQRRGERVMVEGFRSWDQPTGDLLLQINGERNAFLVDVRAILYRDGQPVRRSLCRNWLTGRCALTGLPPGPGYRLELVASGWQSRTLDDIVIEPGSETRPDPVWLRRDPATVWSKIRFPSLNQPAVLRPGESFRARFMSRNGLLTGITLSRREGPALISRRLSYVIDDEKAFYRDREAVLSLPRDMPPGLYDLTVTTSGRGAPRWMHSPRSVHVVRSFPDAPLLVSFGHLDTWGQFQAEYLGRLAGMIDLIAPDFVLNSNAANPAYISGALAGLDMPYFINFGNHRFDGHQVWYGEQVARADFGPRISVLNYGLPWHHGTLHADALLAERAGASIKIINAFEQNAPLSFLDKHRVAMIHDAHGTKSRIMNMGATPTLRVGKINAESFRVVKFRNGRVISATYDGRAVAPFPFKRSERPPLRLRFDGPNDGTRATARAVVENDYQAAFPDGRVMFVMPSGRYRSEGGRIEGQIDSDDGRFTVVSVRVDIPEQGEVVVRLLPLPDAHVVE